MKRYFDDERRVIVSTCSYCGYKYADTDWKNRSDSEGDKPFIEMQESMHSENGRGYYNNIVSHKIFACPTCGVLQIEV